MKLNELPTLVAQIGAHFPEWKVSTKMHRGDEGSPCLTKGDQAIDFMLTNKQGHQIWREADAERVVIDGHYGWELSRHKPYSASYPKITISLSKSPAAIAAEIKRRFLPDYEALHAKMLEGKKSEEDRQNRIQTMSAELVAISGGALEKPSNQYHSPQEGYLSLRLYDSYGHVTVGSNGVRFDLTSVPFKTAARIVAAMRQEAKEEEAA